VKISAVVVVGCRQDYLFTQCCIASIRHFYPEIPIWLFKDLFRGDYDTGPLEKSFRVQLWPAKQKWYGLGWAKLEILCHTPPLRCLLLDSDIVMTGRVLDGLEAFDENFIVPDENHPPQDIAKDFFSLEKLRGLDPEFQFPGFTFNTGHYVATTGRFTGKDFSPFLLEKPFLRLRDPDLFKNNDQSLLNYLLLKKRQNAQLTLRRHSFALWPSGPWMKPISVADLQSDSPPPYLVHWAGFKSTNFSLMPHGHLLEFFQQEYLRQTKA
jgi:hypothetical protein